jgi:NAD(P)-dependent dehydrogenase (short-subunit alcohol dehydrogenase family)
MQRIVISGANRGLGLEFTRQFLAGGARVLAGCRQPGRANELTRLAGVYPGRLAVLPLDVSSERSIAEFARELALSTDSVDVLINNAGVLIEGERFGNVVQKSLVDTFIGNAAGALLVTQALAEFLQKGTKAKVVNISSQLGSIAQTDEFRRASYAMSKCALNMATRMLAAHFKELQIAVVCVHPGWVQTEMGGTQATLTPERAVSDLVALVQQLDLSHSGRFLNHDGSDLPW